MANLTRTFQKIFARLASNNGQFGSLQTGAKVESNDPEVIQALPAYENGWDDAVLSGDELPSLEEMQGLQYKTDTQLAYLLNQGPPEWDPQTEYFIGNQQREIGGSKIYQSITDNNIGNALTDVANWKFLLDLDQSKVPTRKNAIINGDFNIWQRGTSFIGVATGDYGTDRFEYRKFATSAIHDITKSTDVPTLAQAGRLFNYSASIDVTTADATVDANDVIVYRHKIEGYNWLPLAQKTCTISIWVKATKTGVYGVSCKNGGDDRSFVSEITINSSLTWEKKIITIPPSPAAGTWNYENQTGLTISFVLMAGSNFHTTAGSWQTGNFLSTSNQVNACDTIGNTFKIVGVQLEEGAVATPFENRSVQEELILCKRYYQKSYHFNIDPSTPTSPNQGNAICLSVENFSFAEASLSVIMRTIGSLRYWDLAGNATRFTLDGVHNSQPNFGAIVPTERNVSVDISTTENLVAKVEFHFTLDSEL